MLFSDSKRSECKVTPRRIKPDPMTITIINTEVVAYLSGVIGINLPRVSAEIIETQ